MWGLGAFKVLILISVLCIVLLPLILADRESWFWSVRAEAVNMIHVLIFIPVFKESYYNITINYSYNAAPALNPFKIFLSETVDKVRHSTWYVSVVTVLDIMLGSSSIRSLVQCLAPG